MFKVRGDWAPAKEVARLRFIAARARNTVMLRVILCIRAFSGAFRKEERRRGGRAKIRDKGNTRSFV